MVWNPYGWGYGGIGYTMAPTPKSAIKQPAQAQSAVKQYKGQAGSEASDIGSGYSTGPANPDAAMAVGGVVAAMLGVSPVAGMQAGKHAANITNQAHMAPAHAAYNTMTGLGFDSVAAHNMAQDTLDAASAGPSNIAMAMEAGGPGTTEAEAAANMANSGVSGFAEGGSGGSSGSGGGCFITTATAEYHGWEDDCEVLQMLRKFRDEIVAKMPNGKAEIQEYYITAPAIAEAMSDKTKSFVWDKYIKRSVKAITSGKYHRAYVIYKNMMRDLTT